MHSNCILLRIKRYFFSLALSRALSHAKWKVFRDKQTQTMAFFERKKKEMDTERVRETSKLDTMETTFMNCLFKGKQRAIVS